MVLALTATRWPRATCRPVLVMRYSRALVRSGSSAFIRIACSLFLAQRLAAAVRRCRSHRRLRARNCGALDSHVQYELSSTPLRF